MAASRNVSKAMKPDGMLLSMKIDCLNPASLNGAILIKICIAPFVFGNDLLQIHKLRLFPMIKLFEVGTSLNCLSLSNFILQDFCQVKFN